MIIFHYNLDCPETFTMGIHWERTLTKTTNTRKCSDIHPSFKLTDVITRECLRDRTWAPVNMSQCVMNSDSPVVMIVVVTLDTINTSLVKSKQDMIIQQVCCIHIKLIVFIQVAIVIQIYTYVNMYTYVHD